MINPHTDTYAVLCHLEGYGSINDHQAMMLLGVKRLSARINDLKNEGYKIKTVLKKVLKRSGRYTNVTDRYVLEGK
jgi:uncharacterized small protein (DUF1192 family)